jgi:hypothetical protein
MLTVIGAPMPTVDALPVDRLKAFLGAQTLAPGISDILSSQRGGRVSRSSNCA